MGELRLIEGSWPELEAALVDRLQTAPVAYPWSSRWLLVPHRGLRAHLHGLLARRLGALAGLRTLYLREAAGAVVEASGAPPPVMLTEPARDLLLRDAVREQGPAVEALLGGPARLTPAFQQALRKTIYDLREAGIEPDAVAALAAAASGRSRGRLRMVAAVYRSWSERVERLARAHRTGVAAVHDREGLLRSAAAALARGTAVPAEQVVVYGFYDLTGGQSAFLEALSAATGVDLLVPVYPETEAYAGPLLAHWRRLAGEGGGPEAARSPSPAAAGEVDEPFDWLPLEGLFERLQAPSARAPAGERGEGRATVTIASAPGPGREVDLTLRLLAAGWSAGLPAEATRVAAPVPEAYRRLVREEAEGAAFGPPEGSLEAERDALRLLLAVLALTAGEVAAAPLAQALEVLTGPGDPTPPGERLLRELAPAATRAEWRRLLESEQERGATRIAELETEATAGEPADDPEVAPDRVGRLRRLRRRQEQLETGIRLLSVLSVHLDALPAVADWMAWAEQLEALLVALRPLSGEPVALEVLRGLAPLGTPGSREDVRWALRRRLQEAEPGPPFPFGSIMDLRGVSGELTVALGMSEAGWPRRPSPDPLLLDSERQDLRGDRPWLLPDARQRLPEDRLLFRLLLASARQVVLLYPRLEVDGKVRRASPHLLGLARRIIDPDLTQDGLERLARRGVRRLDDPAPGPAEPLLGRLDRDLAAVGRAIEDRDPEALHALWDSPTFRAGWRAEQARWQAGPGPWSGFLSPPAARAAALRFGLEEPGRLSVSRLQDYAICPWRAFLLHVLGLTPERAAVTGRLDPQERGQVLHRVLEVFVSEEVAAGRWPPGGEGEGDPLVRLEGLVEREVRRAYRDRGPAAPVLERVDRRRLLDRLRAWLAWEGEPGEGGAASGSRAGEWLPSGFEVTFAVPLESAGRRPVLHGRLDRVDTDPAGRRRIVDYKTGSRRPTGPDEVAGGTNLQLALYLQALCRGAGAGEEWVAGLLLHLPPAGPTSAQALTAGQLAEREEALAAVVAGLLESVAAGVYTRLPHARHLDRPAGGLCRDCPAPVVCRGWRIEEALRHLESDRLHPLNRVRALPPGDRS